MICVRTKSLHITLEGDQHFCYSTRGSCLQREEFKRRHFKQTVFSPPLLVFGNDLGNWLFFFLSFTCLCVLCKVPPIQILFFFFFFNKKMNNKIEKAFFVLLLLQFLIRHLLLYPFSTCTNGGTTVIVLEVFALSATYSS